MAKKLTRGYVEKHLRLFPFVRWDRFCMWGRTYEKGLSAFGWINRPGDEKKDFLILDFYEDREVVYMTSSKKFSLPIYKILNEGSGRGHSKCKRIEHHFRVKNAIHLRHG